MGVKGNAPISPHGERASKPNANRCLSVASMACVKGSKSLIGIPKLSHSQSQFDPLHGKAIPLSEP